MLISGDRDRVLALARSVDTGEARGPEGVWETLNYLQPSRLGHGVRSIEEPELVDYLLEHQIHLEVCPSSNVQTDVYETYADHPIDALYRDGVSVSVNTDTRGIGNITLSEEYAKLHRTFGWDTEQFFQCNKNALNVAFVPEDVRQKLVERSAAGY